MASIPTLGDLVREGVLDGLAGSRDPIRKIGEAERLADELTHLGESLVGFFVEQARAEGLSWADIGAPRGLSRQGAQQRYTPFVANLVLADLIEAGVLQRFGETALAALRRAEGHAARLGHDAIDSGDLLLGVLDDDESPAAAAIRELGLDPVALRSELDQPAEDDRSKGRFHRREQEVTLDVRGAMRAAEGASATGSAAAREEASNEVPLGAEARRALDGAVSEARGHLVGPGHLLLGLLRNPAGRAGRVLGSHGITKSRAMAAVLAVGNRQSAERG